LFKDLFLFIITHCINLKFWSKFNCFISR